MIRTHISFSLFLLASAACGGTSHSTVAPDAPTPDLSGRWASSCVDPGSGNGIRLSFDIAPTTWKLDYQTFGDATCQTPFLVVHIEGGYAVTGPSANVAGANEARFGFTTKTVTPLSDAAAGFLPQACGGGTYTVGTASDISQGCPGLGAYPIASCPADFDVVAVSGQHLQFGNRPADNNMCTPDKRPTALSPILLQRQ